MATKTKSEKKSLASTDDKAENQDRPVLDLSDAAVKKMIKGFRV